MGFNEKDPLKSPKCGGEGARGYLHLNFQLDKCSFARFWLDIREDFKNFFTEYVCKPKKSAKNSP